jgi:hypothetical protein
MAEDWTETTPGFRQEKQREALGALISLMATPRTSAEWSEERVAKLVAAAYDAGLSPDFIAAEANMSVNDVREILEQPPKPKRPHDWMTVHLDPPHAPRAKPPEAL